MGQIEAWQGVLSGFHERFAGRFARSEPRARALTYMAGLIAPMERKNGWTLAERAGEGHPIGMQRLLGQADWDADGVRDDVRDFVVETIGAKDGILIGDDTGFLKKGAGSAGYQRQYTGTAGRTENSQGGTFLAYASAKGRALIDRELYLPASWTDDRERCRVRCRMPTPVIPAPATMLKRSPSRDASRARATMSPCWRLWSAWNRRIRR